MANPRETIFKGLCYADLSGWDALVISKYGGIDDGVISPNLWFNGKWNNKQLIVNNVKIANIKATKALMQVYVDCPK